MSVRQAAEMLVMTTGGVYHALRAGRLPGKRVNGRWTVARVDVREFERAREEFLRKSDPSYVMTDEEFIQMLWDNDPD